MSRAQIKSIVCSFVRWHTAIVWPAIFALASGAVLANKFGFAYSAWVVLVGYSIGAWLCSSTLQSKRPIEPLLHLPNDKKLFDRRTYRVWALVPCMAIAMLAIVPLYITHENDIDYELTKLEGWLYPENDPFSLPCPIGKDDLALLTGSGNVSVARTFPHTVISINCDDVLVIDRARNGAIGATLRIFDDSGKIIVELDKGYFRVNQNNVFRVDRHHSRSTLSVIDQQNNEVLYLHLQNKNVLQIRGVIRDKRLKNGPIRLDGGKDMSVGQVTGNCMYAGPLGIDFGHGTCLVR